MLDTDFTREENERWFNIMWDLRTENMKPRKDTKPSAPPLVLQPPMEDMKGKKKRRF